MENVLPLICLGVIMGLVLILPFSIRWVEEELEGFLLVMGILAVTTSGLWSLRLVHEALVEPIKISLAVLVFGFLFRWGQGAIKRGVTALISWLGLRIFLFLLVAILGFFSSVITAIVAALVLVEVISVLKLEKNKERSIVILACYSIGLGAVLTPLGEPLSTIATSKLAGPPYHADFFFLARLLWPWISAGIFLTSLLALGFAGPHVEASKSLTEDSPESTRTIMVRSFKVYVFVTALVFLGHGFSPFVERYLIDVSKTALYWINMVSAILDNATLAAAEISPKMSLDRIQFLLMGLLISGGMLIPGNIPNIISANKLKIGSRDWAKLGVPLGVIFLILYFFLLEAVSP